MKDQKKSPNEKARSKTSKKWDSVEVIFAVQRMIIEHQNECVESFVRTFCAHPQGMWEPPFPNYCKSVTNTVYKGYKYRLYPEDDQKEFLAQHFGAVRWVYNHFLEKKIEKYKLNRERYKYPEMSKDLTQLKKDPQYNFLKKVYSQSLQQALQNLDDAFQNFYDKRARFPRFHSRFGKNTFTVSQNAKIIDDRLILPKFKKGIPIVLHRGMPKGKIGAVTISKTRSGEYYASFCVEEEIEVFEPVKFAVGIDMGVKDLAVTSDGVTYPNHKYLKKYEKKLAKAQRDLSRKQKGSARYERQREKVARLERKVANCRKDYLHKCTIDLVRKYLIICVEDLNIKGLLKNRHLSKAISDASWGTFLTMLKYKASRHGRIVVEIPRYYPSSQICCHCGYKNEEVKNLKVREWSCPCCGSYHDRDRNSSINLRRIGLGLLGMAS